MDGVQFGRASARPFFFRRLAAAALLRRRAFLLKNPAL